jgi:hypothetical protein
MTLGRAGEADAVELLEFAARGFNKSGELSVAALIF